MTLLALSIGCGASTDDGNANDGGGGGDDSGNGGGNDGGDDCEAPDMLIVLDRTMSLDCGRAVPSPALSSRSPR